MVGPTASAFSSSRHPSHGVSSTAPRASEKLQLLFFAHVFRLVEQRLHPSRKISGHFYARQTEREDFPRHGDCGLNLDLEDILLWRKKHAVAKLLWTSPDPPTPSLLWMNSSSGTRFASVAYTARLTAGKMKKLLACPGRYVLPRSFTGSNGTLAA